MLMLKLRSVTAFCSDRIVQSTELCGGLGPQTKYTPLHFAAMNGHSEAVQLLLTAKANADAETSVNDCLL